MSLISEVKSGLSQLEQSNREMRKFAITMAVALTILGALVFFFGSHPERAYWLGGIGAAFLILGFLLPIVLKPIHVLWMGLALVLGFFMSRLLLTLLYFVILTPIGLIMRLFGKDLLNEKLQPDAESYWIKRERQDVEPERYEKLY
jgi:hypothetical protein